MISDIYKSTIPAHTTEYILSEVERLGVFCHLDDAGARKLRLLTEELLSLTVRLFDGNLEYEFFIENKVRRFRLNLNAKVIVNQEQKEKMLLLVGENEGSKAKGILSKISKVFQNMVYGDVSLYDPTEGVFIFSLTDYRNQNAQETVEEQWDGIEQSIILALANNVRMSIDDNSVEVVIEVFL